MDSPWTIRRVGKADAEHVAAHGHHHEDDAARRAQLAAWIRPRIAGGHYVGYLALAGADVIGGAGAVLLDWGPTRANPGGQMARINNVFVDARWRRRGIARALLSAVMADCEARGVREFNLGATEAARPLYAALGFEPYPAEMRRRVV